MLEEATQSIQQPSHFSVGTPWCQPLQQSPQWEHVDRELWGWPAEKSIVREVPNVVICQVHKVVFMSEMQVGDKLQ